MEIIDYSDKSVAVFGDTKPYADQLKNIGGKYNPNLKGRAGWIFSKTKRNQLENMIGLSNKKQQQMDLSDENQKYIINDNDKLIYQKLTMPVVTPPKYIFNENDKLTYQNITVPIIMPIKYQKVILTLDDDKKVDYYVSELNGDYPVDYIELSSYHNEIKYTAKIIKCEWVIHEDKNIKITFC